MDCPKCGKSYDSEQGLKIHYGRSHEGSIAGTEVSCHTCGDTFRVEPYRAEEEDVRLFCSQECRAEEYAEKVELTCEWCGDTFERVPSKVEDVERHYCSTGCKGRAYQRQVELECENCGDTFERVRAEAVRADNHYCGVDCRLEHQRGAAHPQYKGTNGLDMAVRRLLGGVRWKATRRRMHKKHPDAICRMCGAESSANGRALQLHHIVPVMAGGTHVEDNLMFLCHPCHRVVEGYTTRTLEYPLAELVDEHGEITNDPTEDRVQVES